jgi:long-chain fatty acid transport protein
MRTIDLAGLLALGLAASALPAYATNGYFSHGYGTVSKGMAGAGSALAVDFMAAATNPAATVVVGPGVDFGVAVFSPDREYDVTGQPSGFPGTFGLAPGAVRSGSRVFAIPHVGLTWRLGGRATVGLAMYGNGGMNTNYAAPVFGVTPAGVDLSQMFIAPTYSVRLDDRHSLGVTGLLGYQRFEAKGLAAFGPFSSNARALTDLDHSNSFGAGVRVGYLGQWSRHFSFGASYQTKVWMSPFEEYEGLFAGEGDFDVPSNFVVGIAVKPTEAVDLAFDVQRVNFSEIEAVGNPMFPNMMQTPLGTEEGAGFGWEDVTVGKVGVQVRGAHGFTWRGGYSFGSQPIPSSEMLFNVLAPGVVVQHATFGLSKDLARGHVLNLAVMHAFSTSVTGPNPLEVPGLQHIELTMNEWEVELGYVIRFK